MLQRTTNEVPAKSEWAKTNPERQKEIKQIVNLSELNDGWEFETDNMPAWRTSFYRYLNRFNKSIKPAPERKFTIRLINGNKYNIWRVE